MMCSPANLAAACHQVDPEAWAVWAEWKVWTKRVIPRFFFFLVTMDILDTSSHSKEELVRILSKELETNPLLILTGPQGGGKTTLAIKLLSENVGGYFEGRARCLLYT